MSCPSTMQIQLWVQTHLVLTSLVSLGRAICLLACGLLDEPPTTDLQCMQCSIKQNKLTTKILTRTADAQLTHIQDRKTKLLAFKKIPVTFKMVQSHWNQCIHEKLNEGYHTQLYFEVLFKKYKQKQWQKVAFCARYCLRTCSWCFIAKELVSKIKLAILPFHSLCEWPWN